MRESTLWLLSIVSAMILVIAVGIHLSAFTSILSKGYVENLRFENVVAYGKNPLLVVSYIVFLGVGLYHGMYGLRSMVFELTISDRAEKALSWVFILLGVLAFAYGSYVVIATFTVL